MRLLVCCLLALSLAGCVSVLDGGGSTMTPAQLQAAYPRQKPYAPVQGDPAVAGIGSTVNPVTGVSNSQNFGY